MSRRPGIPRILAHFPTDGSAMSLGEHLRTHGPLPSRSGTEIRAAVDASGLRGRGGAGFPTGRKLASVAGARSGKAPVVVANGAEGEPASGKDRLLLGGKPHLVLDGISLAVDAVGADRAVLCLHDGSPVRTAVEAALSERRAAGIDACPVEIVTVPARYVASEESAVVQWLTRGRALPTTRPPRPDQRGVDGRPTLVNNVETLAHLALIARYGPGWFTETGTHAEPGTTLVTVTGAVAAPGVREIEVGTPLAEVMELCGGLAEPVSGYLIGGYFGGWLSPEHAGDVQLSHGGLKAVGGALGAGVLLALPSSVCPLYETGRIVHWLAAQSAGQCGPCRFGLPAISGAFEAVFRGRLDRAGHTRLRRWIGEVQGRGACHHPDGTARFVSTALSVFQREVDLHARGGCSAPQRTRIVCPLPLGSDEAAVPAANRPRTAARAR